MEANEPDEAPDARPDPRAKLKEAVAPTEPDHTAALRAASALSRTRDASNRDRIAQHRDLSARARDRAAEARDRAAEREAALLQPEGDDPAEVQVPALRRALEALRAWAAADRAQAAIGRQQAASDRAQAGADRRQARIDLGSAHLDALTGVYTRGLGEETLRHEIDRSHRLGEPFVLAFVDVDGLKAVNDNEGHVAGDALLRSVADALRAGVRSYDPVARVGGDEFICGFTGSAREAAERRVAEIQATLAAGQPPRSISVGLAELGPGDTLERMVARGDAELYRIKQSRPG